MRNSIVVSAGALFIQLVMTNPTAAQQQFEFRGQLAPQGQVNFNDPYRLMRPTLRYSVDLVLTVAGGRIAGTARMQSGNEEASFPVEGRVKDLDCEFRAGNFMRFQGLCASEMIIGDAVIDGGQAPAQFTGTSPRGSWLGASSGLAAESYAAPKLPVIRCQLPPLSLSQPQPALTQSQSELVAANAAYRRDQAELSTRAVRAQAERDKALQAIELSGGELAQLYKTNSNWNNVLRRGSPAIGQMAQTRAIQLDRIENEPTRVAANAALGPAVQAMRSVSSPAEKARLEDRARAVVDSFQRWDMEAASIAAALPATSSGVNDAMTLEAATPLARACATSLSSVAQLTPTLPVELLARAPVLSPAVVASVNAASTGSRSSIELQTRVGQLRQGSLFRETPGMGPALAKADARVAELGRLEAAERTRKAQQAAAAQAERRKRGLLGNDDIREAIMAEIAAVEPNAELRGDSVVRTELGIPVLVFRPTVSGTSCTSTGGSSSCSYELRLNQAFMGLPLPSLPETRRDTIIASAGGLRSPTYRQEARERLARSQAAGPPPPNQGPQPPQQLPFDLLIQGASPF